MLDYIYIGKSPWGNSHVLHIICYKKSPLALGRARYTRRFTATWPLHDIVITNRVWCMAYQREVEGGSYIAQ